MNLGTHLPFFMAGITCCRIFTALHRRRPAMLGVLLLIAALLAALPLVTAPRLHVMLIEHLGRSLTRNLWTVIFGASILAACTMRLPFLERGPLHRLGTLSFSVYLLHPVIMNGIGRLGFPSWIMAVATTPLVGFILAGVVTTACVWLASEVSFRLVEQPGVRLGRQVAARFSSRAVVPIATPEQAPVSLAS